MLTKLLVLLAHYLPYLVDMKRDLLVELLWEIIFHIVFEDIVNNTPYIKARMKQCWAKIKALATKDKHISLNLR